jgi:hypothetical protein
MAAASQWSQAGLKSFIFVLTTWPLLHHTVSLFLLQGDGSSITVELGLILGIFSRLFRSFLI